MHTRDENNDHYPNYLKLLQISTDAIPQLEILPRMNTRTIYANWPISHNLNKYVPVNQGSRKN